MVDAAERLWDIEQIRNLKARYFRFLDTKQWDAFGALFTDDASLRFGPGADDVFTGRDAIVGGVRALLADAVTVHHGHTSEIDVVARDDAERGEATGVWAMADDVELPGLRLHGAGHYFDRYQHDGDRWRIASSELVRLRADLDEPGDAGSARSAIAALVARYNSSADAGRFDETLGCFTDDAVMELPDAEDRDLEFRGKDAIRTIFTGTAASLRGAGHGRVQHFTSAPRIEMVDAGRATGRTYYLVLLSDPGTGLGGPDHWGRYVDEYRKEGTRWLIAHRRVTTDGRAAGGWAARDGGFPR